MYDFGIILRNKRRESGLSQRRLAEKVNVDFSYISKLENGRTPPPSAGTIIKISEALNCAPEDLLAAAKKMPTDIGDAIAAKPSAQRFLQEAFQLNLSPDEWERMIGDLRRLSSDGV